MMGRRQEAVDYTGKTKRSAMYDASDLRKGLKVEIEGVPYDIVDFSFVKPGKGQAMYTCKLKNMITGAVVARTYRSADKLDQPHLEERKLTYSYAEADTFVFMNEDYEQVALKEDALGRGKYYLAENMEVKVLFHNERPIEVVFPTWVEKEVIETEPGARGNTATNVLKPAKLTGGYELQVPLFVCVGDIVRVDTRTGEYADRVRKT